MSSNYDFKLNHDFIDQPPLRLKNITMSQIKSKQKPNMSGGVYAGMPSILKKTTNTSSSHERHVSFDNNRGGGTQDSYGTNDQVPVKLSSLADEYKARQQQMDSRLKKEIENHQIAKVYSKNYQSAEKPINIKIDKSASKPLQANESITNLPFEEKPAQFYRSTRSVALRIKDTYENQVTTLESDKITLIQKLNDALVTLDQLNLEKSNLSNKLIELLKFVREMQRETHKCDDLNGVVSDDLKIDLKGNREMSVQLKEELKRAEMERLHILTKLKDLANLEESLQEESAEMKVKFHERSRMLEDIEHDYRDVIHRIDEITQENDHLKANIIMNKEAMNTLIRKINEMQDEREKAQDKLRIIQDRYDSAITNFNRERHDIDMMHDRHLRLLSSSLLFNTLQSAMNGNLKYVFELIKQSSRAKRNVIKGLIQMRTLFKTQRKRKLKQCLHDWYRSALKPIDNIKQKQLVSYALQTKNPQMFAFYKWQNAFQKSLQRTHLKRQVIAQMLHSKNRFHLRIQKHFFLVWRDFLKVDLDSKSKTLKKYILKKLREEQSKYLYKWREVCQDFNMNIQLHGMGQRLAHKQHMTSLFQAWRLVSTDLKNKRLAVLNRYWKNMKIYVIIRKQLRCQALTILREGKDRQVSLVKACFDAMRVNKESEKFEKVSYQLYEVEIPRRENAEAMLKKVEENDNDRFKAQAVNAIGKCLGKILQGHFNRWKDNGERKVNGINNNLKQMLITRFYQRLRDSFTTWIAFKGHQMTFSQQQIIIMQEEQKEELVTEISQAKLEIEEKEQRQKCQSGKQMKKIIMGAFQRQLRERFNQWKTNQSFRMAIQFQTEKVLNKLERRYKRLAFNKYLEKVKEIKEDALFEKRVEEIRFKLRERERQRIFNAIKHFAECHLRARRYLHRLLTRLDIGLKHSAIRKWSKYRQSKHEKHLNYGQHQKVEEISSLNDQVHQLHDQLEEKCQNIKKLQKQLRGSSERIIKVAFQRYFYLSTQHGFDTWLAAVKEMKRKEQIMRIALVKLKRGKLEDAFKKWTKIISEKQQHIFEVCISSEESAIEKITAQKRKNDQIFRDNEEDCSSKIEQTKKEQSDLMRKHGNTVRTLISRVDNNFCIKKERYILQQWRQYIQNRKRFFIAIENVVKKNLQQIGFNEIKQEAREAKEDRNLENSSSLLFKKFYKIKIRQAFIKWQMQGKSKVDQNQDQLEKRIQNLVNNHNKSKKKINARTALQFFTQHKQQTLTDCFFALKNYYQQSKLFRTKINQYKLWSGQRQQQNAIQKWNSRKRVTNKFRHIKKRIDNVVQRQMAKSVIEAWRETNYRQKRMCQTLANLSISVNRIYMKRAISKIKLIADSKGERESNSKQLATNHLFSTLNQVYQIRMKSNFKDLQVLTGSNENAFLKQKSTVKFWLTQKVRQYFLQWKEESERREVVRYNMEEGPIAVEAHILKKIIFNLKKAAEMDGIERPKIEEVVVHDRRKSLRTIEKSICRLFCYNDEFYLLPQCIDRWRKWVQYRKLYRYWLNYLNNRVDSQRSDLAYAFQKWKYVDLQRQQFLQSMKKRDLDKICVKNADRMNEYADQIEGAEETINELTDQRDFLLQKYVGSQKLALAVSNASCDRAKQRTISSWISSTSDQNCGLFEDALKNNLMRISALKDKIKNLEKSNEDIADQNEELRAGALDGIEMAKSIDDLSREREKLSIDLADKAIIIRKLLEDNHNLSVRLSNAQDEAQNLIRISQMKLQSSERGIGNMDDYYN